MSIYTRKALLRCWDVALARDGICHWNNDALIKEASEVRGEESLLPSLLQAVDFYLCATQRDDTARC